MSTFISISSDYCFNEITAIFYNSEDMSVERVISKDFIELDINSIQHIRLIMERISSCAPRLLHQWHYYVLYRDTNNILRIFYLGGKESEFPSDIICDLVICKTDVRIDNFDDIIAMVSL